MKRKELKEGMRVFISGDSDELWIKDYHVHVSSNATVLETPSNKSKKVLVCIDNIDGDNKCNVYVRISKICEERI